MEYTRLAKIDGRYAEYLARFPDRLGPAPPRGAFVAENDEGIAAMLLVWTEPHVHVSVVVDGYHPVTLPKLATYFERWLKDRGVTQYAFQVHRTDYHYRRIVERRGAVSLGVDAEGYVRYLQEIDVQPPSPDGVDGWAARDWSQHARNVEAFLQEHYAAGGDYPPTKGNVATFVRRGIKATDDGDPALVYRAGGELAGFVLWTGANTCGLDTREPVCLGIGTWVSPMYRRKGVSVKLRQAALAVARAKGYARVDGVALDERGLKAGLAVGGKATGVLVRLPTGVN